MLKEKKKPETNLGKGKNKDLKSHLFQNDYRIVCNNLGLCLNPSFPIQNLGCCDDESIIILHSQVPQGRNFRIRNSAHEVDQNGSLNSLVRFAVGWGVAKHFRYPKLKRFYFKKPISYE